MLKELPAARELGIKATILMPEYASSLKRQAAASYGAEIALTEDRKAELKVSESPSKVLILFLLMITPW